MKCMAGKEWGQSWETQRNLYLSYVRTTLEYASPSWYPWLSETKKRKLERVQNEALRSISGLTKIWTEDFLRLESEVLAWKVKKTVQQHMSLRDSRLENVGEMKSKLGDSSPISINRGFPLIKFHHGPHARLHLTW